MTMRLFSDAKRPVHLGPYPCERLTRTQTASLGQVPAAAQLSFDRPDDPTSIVNAMREHQAMLDAIRDGLVNKVVAKTPDELEERANHLKAFGYFSDAAIVGMCKLPDSAILQIPHTNPDVAQLAHDLRTRQTKTLASGIDLIMADLRDSMNAPPRDISNHTHAIVFLYENPRDPDRDEPGTAWIKDAQAHRACLLSAETAVVIANYLRLLGHDARAHTGTSADVDLNQLAVAAGLATVENGALHHPYIGARFGLSVITTTYAMATDLPLAPMSAQPKSAFGWAWKTGKGSLKDAKTAMPYANRRFVDGAHPFEKLKRVADPTTYIDEPNVARVPKRTDMFARAQFGDMGKTLQDAAKGGHYVRKAAPSSAQRRALGAFVLLQDGPSAQTRADIAPDDATALIKATSYYLGVDAVGMSRCPEWAWYSHDARGDVIDPPHDNAVSMIIDQGYDSMEGSSGDDWIAVAQSMRAYLRFSMLGGVIAKQIRSLGYSAKAHTVMDGEVLQPPLLLLSGLGEVSRIGEVILNPYLGPRLKSGAVTTDMPLSYDQPIDFGLQTFCAACNKCARECPAGAITAGPKLMFNGYEIWKSDSQKCATYRITTEGGAMCGRCMKTCPWNLEGVFKEAPFRWAAMHIPKAAPLLAKLDDAVGNGGLNPIKKWWWDLEITEDGGYRPTDKAINNRSLQAELDLKYEDQTLAVYPANLAPHPYPYPYPMDREAGIAAYQAMLTAEAYRAKLKKGDRVDHIYTADGDSPVIQVEITCAEAMTDDVMKYEFQRVGGGDLPAWTAGAHLDIVVAPEYLRQYSMSGDPSDPSRYQIGVLREDAGRGGSLLMHRIFEVGRKIFISKPINHFPLDQDGVKAVLCGGGIGITPMIAMAHELHRQGRDFSLHYSGRTRDQMGYLDDLSRFDWADKVSLHISDEGSRADFDAILAGHKVGHHVYCCGAVHYMNAVMQAAENAGVPEDARHLEYFSVPDQPEYEDHAFTLRLSKSNKTINVGADQTATDALAAHGIHVDVKCSDGICGVCKCALIKGDVDHRDFVLSNAQRRDNIILCQSRASEPGGEVEIDL